MEFLEGQIDRPVVIGSLYNGRGQAEAAHNQIAGGASGSTGNAPAWFPGNQHAGVLSGWKTQDLSTSATGSGGYRHLQFDDTPGQSRVQLYTTDQDSGLTLGHLKQNKDNQRLADRGYGVELHTQAQGALRAGTGLLLTTEPADQQMQAKGLLAELEKAQGQVDQLADNARQQKAGLASDGKQLPTSEALQNSQESLKATQQGTASGTGIGGGEGQVAAWSKPLLALYGQAGVLSLTPKHQIWATGTQCLLNAGADINFTAQGHTAFLAAQGLMLFTRGAGGDSRPIANTGIALHAASGAVSVQAQSDKIRMAAQQNIRLVSTQGNGLVQGKEQVLLSVQGATVRLVGGNIEIHAPGTVTFKAQRHALTGPKNGAPNPAVLNKGRFTGCEFKNSEADMSGASVV
ncbi:DUF2345 domain-containing protein [Pseudomonas sp. 1079]|nr:DUF2345 domain-containing protein [Pseudomonas sp. 1079]